MSHNALTKLLRGFAAIFVLVVSQLLLIESLTSDPSTTWIIVSFNVNVVKFGIPRLGVAANRLSADRDWVTCPSIDWVRSPDKSRCYQLFTAKTPYWTWHD